MLVWPVRDQIQPPLGYDGIPHAQLMLAVAFVAFVLLLTLPSYAELTRDVVEIRLAAAPRAIEVANREPQRREPFESFAQWTTFDMKARTQIGFGGLTKCTPGDPGGFAQTSPPKCIFRKSRTATVIHAPLR